MQATITYLLTEQAQRAQMAATGQPVARKQVVTVDTSAEDLDIMQITPDGTPYLDLCVAHHPWGKELQAAGAEYSAYNPEANIAKIPHAGADILALIKSGRAKVAESAAADKRKTEAEKVVIVANGDHNRAQTEIAYRAFVANPAARSGDYTSEIRRLVADIRTPADWWPESHDQLLDEIKRRNAADAAAKQSAETIREKAKDDFITAWIADLDEEFADLKQQFAEGLLCRSVALSMIADAAFAAAGIPAEPTYDDDFCRNQDCPCGQKILYCLPRKVYPTWRAIKGGLPEGYAVEFQRVRECLRKPLEEGEITPDEFEAGADPIYLAKIKMPHGPFTFERTVKLG